jgi:hypothetical protein
MYGLYRTADRRETAKRLERTSRFGRVADLISGR